MHTIHQLIHAVIQQTHKHRQRDHDTHKTSPHIGSHTNINTHINTGMHTFIHHAGIPIYIEPSCIRRNTHAQTRTSYLHTGGHTRIHPHRLTVAIHNDSHTHIITHAHTFIHTYMVTHTSVYR